MLNHRTTVSDCWLINCEHWFFFILIFLQCLSLYNHKYKVSIYNFTNVYFFSPVIHFSHFIIPYYYPLSAYRPSFHKHSNTLSTVRPFFPFSCFYLNSFCSPSTSNRLIHCSQFVLFLLLFKILSFKY